MSDLHNIFPMVALDSPYLKGSDGRSSSHCDRGSMVVTAATVEAAVAVKPGGDLHTLVCGRIPIYLRTKDVEILLFPVT